MTTTSPVIILTVGDSLLSSVSSPDTHSRADIDDLITGEAVRGLKYATYEPDKWLLDGSFHFAPDPAHIGFVSDAISLVDKSFTSNPVLTLTLDAVADIEQGVTLEFSNVSGDYATALNIEYQDAGTAPIDDDDYIPTGYNFFAEAPVLPVEDVKFIVITFSETSEAYRHIKLLDVYVDGILFDKENIDTSNVIEQIDQTSLDLPSNELNFSVENDDGDFSIVNPQGFYASLAEGQKVDAYEFVNDTRIYMGRFYLKDWDSINENLASFTCYDAVYYAERIVNAVSGEFTYIPPGGSSGLAVSNQLISDYLTFVFFSLEFDFTVDSALVAEIMTGFIDVEATLRKTLQLIGSGARSYVTSARSTTINLIKTILVDDVVTWDYIFTDNDIGENPKVTLKPLVTGIDLTAHDYPIDNKHNDFQVFDGSVTNGVRFIKFPSDFYGDGSWVKTGTSTSSVTSYGVRFMEITTSGPGTLDIYIDTSRMHSIQTLAVRTAGVPSSAPENIITIKEATLVTPYNGDDVLDFIDNYFQQRYVCEFELFASLVEIGDAVKVPIQGEIFGGIVEKIESDLSGGFVQKVTATGKILL